MHIRRRHHIRLVRTGRSAPFAARAGGIVAACDAELAVIVGRCSDPTPGLSPERPSTG